jgi:hypothetical protein
VILIVAGISWRSKLPVSTRESDIAVHSTASYFRVITPSSDVAKSVNPREKLAAN